jgi:hypothetical protein
MVKLLIQLAGLLAGQLVLLPVASATPTPLLGGLGSLVDTLLALGADPPPAILQTQVHSPECADVNKGELLCCRGTVAGDLQPIVFLAALYGYDLNPNDVNGLDCTFERARGQAC